MRVRERGNTGYDCTMQKIGTGEVDKENAKKILRKYKLLFKQKKQEASVTDSDMAIRDRAMEDAVRQWALEAADRIRQVRIQKDAQVKIYNAIMAGFTTRNIGMKDRKKYLEKSVLSIIESSGAYEQLPDFRNVVQREHSLRQRMQDEMYNALKEFDKFDFNGWQPATALDITRVLLGESSDNPFVASSAATIRRVLDYLHAQYKEAGGIAGRLDNYVPQSHDVMKIKAISQKEWVDFVIPHLQLEKMIDYETGLAFTPDTVRTFLGDIYQNITTQGWHKKEVNSVLRGRSLGKKHADPRILHFKDADSQIAYQQRFGEKDVFAEIISYITYMTRDIAVMQTLGPHPNATLVFLKELVSREAALAKEPVNADAIGKNLQALYDTYMGRTNAVADKKLADIGGTMRSVAASAVLGKAVLSAFADMGTASLMAHLNNIPISQHIGQMLKQLNPASAKNRRKAAQEGVLLDGLMFDNAIAGRFGSDPLLKTLAGRLETRLYKVTGLNFWTNAQRSALQMSIYARLADAIDTDFSAIDPILKNRMTLYNITQADWKKLRGHYGDTPPLHITPKAVREDVGDEELAEKIFAWADTDARKGILSSSHRVRKTHIKGERGTLIGEFLRSFFQLKSFPYELTHKWLFQMGQDSEFLAPHKSLGRYHHIARYFITMGILGYAVSQLKDIAQGKDPQPLSIESLIEGFLQSGGVGYLGDAILNLTIRQDKYNYDVSDALGIVGVSVSMTGDIIKGVVNDVAQTAKEGEFSIAKTTKALTNWQPYGNVWYMEPFMHALHYELNSLADPQFEKKLRRRIRKNQRTTGQKSWWEYGEAFPERAPDFSNFLK